MFLEITANNISGCHQDLIILIPLQLVRIMKEPVVAVYIL
jgi:hypothetical protein